VVPKSTLSNWINEVNKWCPSLKVVKLHGNKADRKDQLERFKTECANILLTTYEVSLMEKGFLASQHRKWSYLIIDEAHRIKNEESQLSKVVRTFDSR
jgi:SWI/SNF-related matrix-associated actin-dependent regulator of chromatin subfamily A member 5